jgi:hypothetical protein
MDTLGVLVTVGLVVGAVGVAAIIVWLRIMNRALERHREALVDANRINSRAVEAAREANQIARKANLQSRKAFQQQWRLSTYPYLHCDAVAAGDRLELLISNPGSVPAFNVSLFALASFENGETPLEEFGRIYMKQTVSDEWLEGKRIDEPGGSFTYGVFYERSYAQFPASKRVSYPLNLPVLPASVYALLQYESILGESYVHLYNMSTLVGPDERFGARYSVVYKRPRSFESVPRLDVFELDGRAYVVPQGQYVLHRQNGERRLTQVIDGTEHQVDPDDLTRLPIFLQDDRFLATLRLSMPARFLKREFVSAVERDVWSDITDRARA